MLRNLTIFPMSKNNMQFNSCINNIRNFSTIKNIIFRQLFDDETCTFTYLIGDQQSKEAILIDPVIEHAERDANLVSQLGLSLKYAINTHVHADHITGTGLLKHLVPACKSALAKYGCGTADILLKHGDKVLFGAQELEVRSTPGHTNGCITYVDHKNEMAFTGDALLIRGCGRTDFQEGSADKLYSSIHEQIFTLPEHFLLYPAHDYKGFNVTTVEEEMKFNPRATKSRSEFINIMDNLNLEYPKKIDESLPANKVCGLYNLPPHLEKLLEDVKEKMKKGN